MNGDDTWNIRYPLTHSVKRISLYEHDKRSLYRSFRRLHTWLNIFTTCLCCVDWCYRVFTEECAMWKRIKRSILGHVPTIEPPLLTCKFLIPFMIAKGWQLISTWHLNENVRGLAGKTRHTEITQSGICHRSVVCLCSAKLPSDRMHSHSFLL